MLGNNSLIKANLTENYQRFSAKRNKNISQYSKEMDSGKTTISIYTFFFYKQLHFRVQPEVAKVFLQFQPQSCLMVASSV